MSRIPGVTLRTAWPLMTIEDRVQVLADLRQYVLEMRRIPPPDGCLNQVSSFIGKAVRDAGVTLWEAVGPFTMEEFVDFLMDVWIEDRPAKEARFRNTLLHGAREGVFLTHADLHYNNIMVDKVKSKTGTVTYRVTGIVDWQTAGWYPIWWETFSARRNYTRFTEWNDALYIFAGEFPEEMAILRELNLAGPR